MRYSRYDTWIQLECPKTRVHLEILRVLKSELTFFHKTWKCNVPDTPNQEIPEKKNPKVEMIFFILPCFWVNIPCFSRVIQLHLSLQWTGFYAIQKVRFICSAFVGGLKGMKEYSPQSKEIRFYWRATQFIWAAFREKVPNVLSRCHTKRRMDG